MEIGETVYAKTRQEWRNWLQNNALKCDEIWLVYFKNNTQKPSVSYRASVEEAICFGWIDGLKKKIDQERYTHRFTPRRPGSKWSKLNVDLAEKMIGQKKMTEAGLQSYKERSAYSESVQQLVEAKEVELPSAIKKAIQANPKAWKNLQNMAPSYRKQYAAWLTTAKRPETIQKRLKKAIILLEKNEKLGMK